MLDADGNIPQATTRRVVDRVGDCRGDAHHGHFAETLGAGAVEVVVGLVDEAVRHDDPIVRAPGVCLEFAYIDVGSA